MPSEENLILYIFLGLSAFMIIVRPPLNDYDDDGEPTVEPKPHVYVIRSILLILIYATIIYATLAK